MFDRDDFTFEQNAEARLPFETKEKVWVLPTVHFIYTSNTE